LPHAPFQQTKHEQIEQFGKPTSGSIPTIVRLTKSTITKQINIFRNTPGDDVWQRNYYEHVVRDRVSLCRIREYIRKNSHYWDCDQENHIDTEIETFEMVEIEEF
jgi:REP element-mobilizing transposase RayT